MTEPANPSSEAQLGITQAPSASTSSSAPARRLKALEFVGKPQFHRFIKCLRTDQRVAFSIGGDDTNEDLPVLLFCPPSVCSRYVGGPMMHKYALRYNVRILTIDRPGMGGTPRCALEDRIDISTKQTISVLEALNIKKVAILSHSSGSIYAFHLLQHHQELFASPPRLYLTSAWVPTSVSGQMTLPMIPKFMVSSAHVVLPKIGPVFEAIGKPFEFSIGLLRTSKPETPEWKWEKPFRDTPDAVYAPEKPYHDRHSCRPDKEELSLGQDFVMKYEDSQGWPQDFLLCLGTQGLYDGKIMTDTFKAIDAQRKIFTIGGREDSRREKIRIEVFWGEGDALIPKKGRVWLETAIAPYSDTIEYRSVTLKGLGHDDILSRAECHGAIFEHFAQTSSVGSGEPRQEYGESEP